MIELGHLAAFFALAATLVAAVSGGMGKVAAAGRAMQVGMIACLISFVLLVNAFLTSDFSVLLVAKHSHSLKPAFYKFAGAWGNHEGSMLLWCLIMLGFGAIASLVMKNDRLKAYALGVQGGLSFMSLSYLLFASSPFTRVASAPLDGNGLNPLLQDPALAFHPPFLYLGYVGFSFVFSVAAAGLLINEVGSDWAKRVRPWALFSWSALTIGIALGGIWAYYELGWSGWWFWDPVENASLMPWLVGAALVHSIIVTQKRGSMASWTVFLAVLAFCLSILGAFLVRSGVLTSVHAFALDPERGLLLLFGLCVAALFAFVLFAWRGPNLPSGSAFDPISREGALIVNNLFFSVAAATVLVGTLYPLGIELVTGETDSVGEPYFNRTLAPLMALLFLLVPVATTMTWRKADVAPVFRSLVVAGVFAIAAAAVTFIAVAGKLWAVLGAAIGVWVIIGTLTDLYRRVRPGGFERLSKLSLGVWGLMIAHIGLGFFVIGASVETNGRLERTFVMSPGSEVEMAGWTFQYQSLENIDGPNFESQVGTIIAENGARRHVLKPSKRFYPVAGTPTTEVAIRKSLRGDLYVALGEPIPSVHPQAFKVRVSMNPIIDFVFGGVGLIALGGFFAFADRVKGRVSELLSARKAAKDKPDDTDTALPAAEGVS